VAFQWRCACNRGWVWIVVSIDTLFHGIQKEVAAMKRVSSLLFMIGLSAILVSAASCVVSAERSVRGSGRVTEKVHKLRGFSGVEMGTVGNLYIEKGRRNELRVKAEENLHDYLKIDVSDGMLEIKSRRNVNIRPRHKIQFHLTVKKLDSIVLSGAGDVKAPDLEGKRIRLVISGAGNIETGDLDADEILLRISGAGDLTVGDGEADDVDIYISGAGGIDVGRLDAGTARLKISGSGDASISHGTVKSQRITITGSGDYRAEELRSRRAEVTVTGSGSAIIRVEDELKARISGSGDVRYAGRPRVRGSVHGSGDIRRI
jgi:hypothetical protein